MKRSLFRTADLAWLVTFVISSLLASCSSFDNRFTVVNVSDNVIVQLDVSLPWQTLTFRQVDPGSSETQPFEIRHDAHFEFSGRCENGATIEGSDGYVTNGQHAVSVRLEVTCEGPPRYYLDASAI
jgi:hypothetical protein